MDSKASSLVKDRLKSERINLVLKLVIVCLFLSGAVVFSYPFIANVINNFRDQLVIDNYQKEMTKMNKLAKSKRLQTLKLENDKLLGESKRLNIPGIGLVKNPLSEVVKDVEKRDKAYFEKHAIGAIFMPTIQVSLPLFDETTTELLEKGATVLQGTSFPVGGKGTHAVITGHSGLPSKKLFTDLDKLKRGDLFYLDVTGKKLAYQVTRFKTVLPTEIDSLKIEPSSDLVTLITCTPYMVNTHRLLVTGVRVAVIEKKLTQKMTKQISQVKRYQIYRMISLGLCCMLGIGLVLYWTWIKFRNYQRLKNHYDLIYYVRSGETVLAGITFYLLEKRGSQVTNEDGEILYATSDTIGKVIFEALPGRNYRVCAVEPDVFPKIQGYVGQINDRILTLTCKQATILVTGKKDKRKYRISKK